MMENIGSEVQLDFTYTFDVYCLSDSNPVDIYFNQMSQHRHLMEEVWMESRDRGLDRGFITKFQAQA